MSDTKKDERKCVSCGKDGAIGGCRRCGKVLYCSSQCSMDDDFSHRKDCPDGNDRGRSDHYEFHMSSTGAVTPVFVRADLFSDPIITKDITGSCTNGKCREKAKSWCSLDGSCLSRYCSNKCRDEDKSHRVVRGRKRCPHVTDEDIRKYALILMFGSCWNYECKEGMKLAVKCEKSGECRAVFCSEKCRNEDDGFLHSHGAS